MVKKLKSTRAADTPDMPLRDAIKDSAQQIWQAGLGAFSKANAEGAKAFEALVKEGARLQRQTQQTAEDKLAQASSNMSDMAADIASRASGQWDKLEGIFEERVAKALNKLGVPSASDISTLIERIEELNRSVMKLATQGAAPKAAPKKAASKAAKKAAPAPVSPTPVAKRAAPRKAAAATRRPPART